MVKSLLFLKVKGQCHTFIENYEGKISTDKVRVIKHSVHIPNGVCATCTCILKSNFSCLNYSFILIWML